MYLILATFWPILEKLSTIPRLFRVARLRASCARPPSSCDLRSPRRRFSCVLKLPVQPVLRRFPVVLTGVFRGGAGVIRVF